MRVEIDAGGRIDRASRRSRRSRSGAAPEPPVRRLPGRALLPGFVNAHSHAFQRGLRGRGERFPAGGAGGSFWSWREAMYGLVGGARCRGLRRPLARQAFREMRGAGITAVGEFHYLHHELAGEDCAFDDVVRRGGADGRHPPRPARGLLPHAAASASRSPERSAASPPRRPDDLLAADGPPRDAARPATPEPRRRRPPIRARRARATSRRSTPRRRGAACPSTSTSRSSGRRSRMPRSLRRQADAGPPARPLAARRGLHRRALHPQPRRPSSSATRAAGGNVCLCPLTEANLGDGIADVPAMRRAGGGVCLGSDSNARISTLEEMRWLEYGAAARATESRGVLADAAGRRRPGARSTRRRSAARARSGSPPGRIEPGRWADFVAVDLGAPSLAGCDARDAPRRPRLRRRGRRRRRHLRRRRLERPPLTGAAPRVVRRRRAEPPRGAADDLQVHGAASRRAPAEPLDLDLSLDRPQLLGPVHHQEAHSGRPRGPRAGSCAEV